MNLTMSISVLQKISNFTSEDFLKTFGDDSAWFQLGLMD
jgi:hypothetical protein